MARDHSLMGYRCIAKPNRINLIVFTCYLRFISYFPDLSWITNTFLNFMRIVLLLSVLFNK